MSICPSYSTLEAFHSLNQPALTLMYHVFLCFSIMYKRAIRSKKIKRKKEEKETVGSPQDSQQSRLCYSLLLRIRRIRARGAPLPVLSAEQLSCLFLTSQLHQVKKRIKASCLNIEKQETAGEKYEFITAYNFLISLQLNFSLISLYLVS